MKLVGHQLVIKGDTPAEILLIVYLKMRHKIIHVEQNISERPQHYKQRKKKTTKHIQMFL